MPHFSPLVIEGPSALDSAAKVHSLLETLHNYRLCKGNDDPRFDQLSQSRKGVFKDLKGVYIVE